MVGPIVNAVGPACDSGDQTLLKDYKINAKRDLVFYFNSFHASKVWKQEILIFG